MRTSTMPRSLLAGLAPSQKLALGSVLAVVGGAVITLSLLLGWSALPRPWSFLIGLAGGLTGGVGVPLAICGLVHWGRRTFR